MAQTLFVREENGASHYSDEARDIAGEFHSIVEAFIVKIERDSCYDMRDLDSLLTGVVTDVILSELITRRLT